MAVPSLNKVQLIGNLTRDPNLRYTAKNTAVCTFGVATNRTWAGADGGEKQESVEFHNIVAWSKLADICGQILHKGDKVYVEGRLQTRDWKGEDGADRRTTEIVIDNMILLRSRSGGGDYNASDDDYARQPSDDGASKPTQKKVSSKKKKTQNDDEDQVMESSSAEDIADDVPFQ